MAHPIRGAQALGFFTSWPGDSATWQSLNTTDSTDSEYWFSYLTRDQNNRDVNKTGVYFSVEKAGWSVIQGARVVCLPSWSR